MIGLFGGTFDPIHLGHLDLAQKVADQYKLQKIYFVPAKKNPNKKKGPSASPKARLAMVKLSLKEIDDPRFECLDWEISRKRPSYTLLTVKKLLQEKDDAIALLMGNEVFEDLPHWYRPQELLQLASAIVITRDPHLTLDISAVLQQLKLPQIEKAGKRVFHSEKRNWIESFYISALPYSATSLREQVDNKRRHNGMETLPQGIQRSVWLFIKENRLYAVTKKRL